MNKKELLKRVGSIEQIGGIRDFVFNDGRAKGVRAIEINTGKICFTVLPDRCMDIAQASFMGQNVSWISKTGITSPCFYEKDGLGFLRGFYGGLITTCGLKNVGEPYEGEGQHGRIANIPASKVSVFADWVGDEYVMRVSGEMRESVVFGVNLVLKRTITAKLFESSFTVEDTIVNESFHEEGTALCYHCNFGYPLVTDGARMVNVPSDIADITAPVHGKEEECVHVYFEDDEETVGIENSTIGAYITYKRDTLPGFLIWKMMGESEYVVGLEPRTINGPADKEKNADWLTKLAPFEERSTYLKFSFKTLQK